MVREPEMACWKHLTNECMSEESDNEDGTKTRHTPKWRSGSKSSVAISFVHKNSIGY